MYIVDGEQYNTEEEIPDLGSWLVYSVDSSTNKRDYNGFSTDFDKLPTYKDLGNGSTAIALDTGTVYMYSSKTATWYEV